ncbi:amiloride-sensitive amine oxidase [copper-containing]-like isoform X1 [Dendronephthya gigantea]|uniref:amiloride-sensitive amine oxidase [copper-containing]-like isoform X1 n=1 Tax=Dendronephthya gigantea TaxID=151771 RepID=UPI00106D0B10|nr:amiloride-sensitive amine oxidase [copper-containing]-like isoform X1 [Dendronephthya gigantea]
MGKSKKKDNASIPTRLKIAICILVLIIVGLIVALIAVSVNQSDDQDDTKTCSQRSTMTPKFTKSQDLFRDLTEDELLEVRDYIVNNASLNVTPFEKAAVDSNYIFLIELQNPIKDEAVAYLDRNGRKPNRAANVIIFKGAASPPVVEEILVYLDEPMRHEPNTLLTKRTIPFHTRPANKQWSAIIHEIVINFGTKAHHILKESFGDYSIVNCTDQCLTHFDTGFDALPDSDETIAWIWFTRNVPGTILQPVDLQLLLIQNSQGVNATKLKIRVYYNKRIFDSVDEFVKLYKLGNVTKVKLPAPKGKDLTFSTLNRRGTNLQPSLPLREPEQFEPDGKRYTAENNHIEYMGWSFDFRVRTTSGLQLFDIRFNGERIVYELSLQEPASFYSAYSPVRANGNYLDSAWALGANFELVKGVDCPKSARYFDVVYFVDSSKPGKRRNAVCVFEHNLGIPLRRHFENDFEGGYTFYGGMQGTGLVLRTISTPYNYDYIYDFIFYPNGVIESKVSTTGYLLTTFWTPEEDEYGNQVYKNVAGSLHDHMIHYKVDLDIAGRNNRYETITTKIENISSSWFPNKRHVQKRLIRDLKKTEVDAAYKFDFQHPSYLNFYNSAKKNAYGVRRGYRVQLNGILHQLYPENWQFTNGFSWSHYQLAVTKYKKNEERSSSIYNQRDMYNPVVDFKKFILDNESIVDEDLVSWITVAVMHIPHSEDIPNTATPGNHAGFFLRPFNYFDEDPSISSRDSVLITPTDDGSKVDRFGRPHGSQCVPPDVPIDYNGREL